MRTKCLDCNQPKSSKGNYCKKCGYKHRIRPLGVKYKITKVNPSWYKKGNISWQIGIRREFSGKTKDGLHAWVERNLGKPKYCEKCKSTDKKIYQWSNISGQYLAIKNDWQRLCVKCHQLYDYKKFGARKVFYT